MENLPVNYHQTLLLLKERIKLAQYKSLSLVNTELILMYLDLGRVLSEKLKSGWGESIVDSLSKDLQVEYLGVQGFSSRNLRRMKLIFEEVKDNSNWTQAVSKIPWWTYSYRQLPEDIAKYLPTEQEFEKILQYSNTDNK